MKGMQPPVFSGGCICKERMNGRIISLDIGDVRIGVAVSDPSRTIAFPLEVITRIGWGPDVRRIKEICDRYETDTVISGLPLNMDGTEGFQAQKVRTFVGDRGRADVLCAQLEKSGICVLYQDERLSTVSADDALSEANVSRSDRKKNVDKIAAAIILEQWLNEQNQK